MTKFSPYALFGRISHKHCLHNSKQETVVLKSWKNIAYLQLEKRWLQMLTLTQGVIDVNQLID